MFKEYAKRCEKGMMASTLATLILGIILFLNPTGSIKIITSIVAFLFMLLGALQIFDYIKQSKIDKMISFSLTLGVILFGIGIIILVCIDSLIKFVTIVIGAILLIKSLLKLQFALNLKGSINKWNYNLYMGLFGLLISIVIILYPANSLDTFLKVIGALLIISSVAELVETLMVYKNLNDYVELEYVEKKTNKKDVDKAKEYDAIDE